MCVFARNFAASINRRYTGWESGILFKQRHGAKCEYKRALLLMAKQRGTGSCVHGVFMSLRNAGTAYTVGEKNERGLSRHSVLTQVR